MNRVIIDYNNITPEIFKLIRNKYPEGYSDLDMIIFRNTRNEVIKAIEVANENFDYLVKVSRQINMQFESYSELEL